MTLAQASRLLVCAWLSFVTLGAAKRHRTGSSHTEHEARQGTISVQPVSTPGPSPVDSTTSSQTTTTPPPPTTTMSPAVTTTLSQSPEPLSSVNPPTSSVETPPPVTATSVSPQPSPSSTTPQDSSSPSAPQPSTSPASLDFTVSNTTTCTTTSIAWEYSGKDGELLLSITNIGVSQDNTALVKRKSSAKTIQQQLADTRTSAESWTWAGVNLPQGWYQIEGLVLSTPNLYNNSSPFFISNGTDVSCLVATSTQSSSMASATATSPSSSTGSKSNVNVGGIVGGIVGGVAALFLAIIAGVCWSKRRQRAFAAAGNKGQQWGSLKSSVSSMQPGDAGVATNPFQDNSELTGAVLHDTAGGGERVSAITTPGGFDEHEEKLVSPILYSGLSPSDALNTPLHYDRRASTYSSTNSMQTPITATSENFRTRVPSMQQISTQSLEKQAQRIRSSMETSNRRRGERLSMPSIHSPVLSQSPTHAQPTEEYPLTPMTPTPVNRTVSAGAASVMARRGSRKPVPQYDSSTLVESRHTDSVSTLSEGPESSQSHGTGLGTGVHGMPSDSLHKTTLGDGRPVHFLMPDMPSAQLD